MTNGQQLRVLVTQVLDSKKLTLVQEAVINNSTYGDFEPENLTKARIDVMKLSKANDTTELIRLLKQLPLLENAKGYKLFINDNPVSIQQYLDDKNNGTRSIKGISNKSYLEMSLHEYSNSIYGSTKFESFGAENNIFGGAVPYSILNRTKKLTSFCPTAFELITKVVIDKELLRNYDLNSYKNVDEVLNSKHGNDLFAFLTDVIKEPKLIDMYITKAWCIQTKISKPTYINVKPTPQPTSDLTDVVLTDEMFDVVEDNVTVIGVGSDGKLNQRGRK